MDWDHPGVRRDDELMQGKIIAAVRREVAAILV